MVHVWCLYDGRMVVISWSYHDCLMHYDPLSIHFLEIFSFQFVKRFESFILGGIDFIQHFPKTFLSLCTVRNERSLSKIRISYWFI